MQQEIAEAIAKLQRDKTLELVEAAFRRRPDPDSSLKS